MKEKDFVCQICGKRFDYPRLHLESLEVEMYGFHENYLEKAARRYKTMSCICGGTIRKYNYVGGHESLECTACGLVLEKL